MKRICVFCGSSTGSRPIYREAAHSLGRVLHARGIDLVYGGGNVGLMGVVADAMIESGGTVIGIIPEALVKRELAHHTVTELIVVRSMHERKAKMADLSDAFIALPGGYGTFEEFCEIITWAQLGMHRKPCAILNVEGYYDPLLALFDRGVEEGFIGRANRRLVIQETDPSRLLDLMARYSPSETEKWIDRYES